MKILTVDDSAIIRRIVSGVIKVEFNTCFETTKHCSFHTVHSLVICRLGRSLGFRVIR